ncbi:hypothetical protein ACFT9I_13660 [Streptomyces sp. NPDC057137]|uniref:hypothetical protein n=1 Tax=Streptomyces sp. NPDC057137 TaxID=3346030 RepID=UPI003628E794
MTRDHTRAAITAAAAGLLLTLTACSDSTESPADKPAKTVTATPEAEPAPADDTAEDAGTIETAELPDLTGETLQAAQDAAQGAGFYGLTSSDATGAARMQLLDRNWQVCAQDPAAGSHSTDTIVDFSTVKIEESCP